MLQVKGGKAKQTQKIHRKCSVCFEDLDIAHLPNTTQQILEVLSLHPWNLIFLVFESYDQRRKCKQDTFHIISHAQFQLWALKGTTFIASSTEARTALRYHGLSSDFFRFQLPWSWLFHPESLRSAFHDSTACIITLDTVSDAMSMHLLSSLSAVPQTSFWPRLSALPQPPPCFSS